MGAWLKKMGVTCTQEHLEERRAEVQREKPESARAAGCQRDHRLHPQGAWWKRRVPQALMQGKQDLPVSAVQLVEVEGKLVSDGSLPPSRYGAGFTDWGTCLKSSRSMHGRRRPLGSTTRAAVPMTSAWAMPCASALRKSWAQT